MSKYRIEAIKTVITDGIEYTANINKNINIDFSEPGYAVKMREDVHDAEIELIPDSMDFLHEMTEIFPLSDYDYRITQSAYRHGDLPVSVYPDVREKETGQKVYFAESAVLSDDDYDHLTLHTTKVVGFLLQRPLRCYKSFSFTRSPQA